MRSLRPLLARPGVTWFVCAGGLGGIALPILLEVAHAFVDWIGGQVSPAIDWVTLCLWPSSIFLVAAGTRGWDDPMALQLLALSLAANAILYSGISFLIWFGLNRHASVLVATASLVVAGWIALLGL